ncbi:hypothetical protein [Shimia thalassica]|uniref:hypothetical protein n=1 Tax=Shimia thalassica TaxID=1715693 RepID=UPI0026E3769D|nr:hypothetical protein [Shimia thalassica]MDO6483080.1 hypothetical protein [Shimia thalassica]
MMMGSVKDNSRKLVSAAAAVRPIKGEQARVSILELINWAFQRECAQLDFCPISSITGARSQVRSMSAIIAEHERLGCHIDGGGYSEPHPDADLVADAVSHLSEGVGGRRMAIQIAELARLGATPDWMPDAFPRVLPVETHTNRHGTSAKTIDATSLGDAGWPAQPRRNRKGVIVHDAVRVCPVTIRPSVNDIARARRAYLAWYGALLELRAGFRLTDQLGALSAFLVTKEMPARTPWIKSS